MISKIKSYPMRFKSLFFPFIILITLASCSAKRKLVNANKLKKKPTPELLIRQLAANELHPEGIEAKASISYKDEYMSVSGSVTIKTRKDSLIWLSIRKFGFEGARVQITKDSIHILNRLDKEYLVYPLSYIEKEYNLPADFKAIESIILGNPLYLGKNLYELNLEDEQVYHLSNPADEDFLTELTVNRSNFSLNTANYTDKNNPPRGVNLQYDKYTDVENQGKFSYFSIIRYKK